MIGRRAFVELGVAGALTLAFDLGCGGEAPAPRTAASGPRAATTEGAPFEPSSFVRIGRDGRVTLRAVRLEMGQGVRTVLPAMLAEELEVDLRDVTLETPIAGAARDAKGQPIELHTSGSDSSRSTFLMLRVAGASAREMLVLAAARTWSVDPSTCAARRGRVVHAATGRALEYGALVDAARALPVPRDPALKPASAWTTLGKPIPRINGRDIVTGKARYGLDVRVPDMRFAAVLRAPTLGARLQSFDGAAARAVPGVVAVYPVKAGLHAGVAVVAKDTWSALRGRAALRAEWGPSPVASFDSDAYIAGLASAFDGPRAPVRAEGDAPGVLARSAQRFSASYFFPFQVHAAVEPLTCTAHARAGEVEVWAPTQTDVRTIETAARVAGVPKSRVILHCELMGGGFGRRLFADFVAEAVELSVLSGAPIQVVWSREDDMRHGYFQPATGQRYTAGLDAAGRVTSLVHDTTASALTIYEHHEGKALWPEPAKRPPPDYASDQSPWGAYDIPYELPHLRVECADVTSPVPTGPWRAVEYPSTVFGRESFLDELAHRARLDPIEYRIAMLPPDVKQVGPYAIDRARLRRVLELAREKSGWRTPLRVPEGFTAARGVAANVFHAQSYLAMVIEVAVAKDLSRIRPLRAFTVVDCGAALNPLGIEGQTESGIAWGLTAALHGKADFKAGRPMAGSYKDYEVLRIDQMPAIETFIVPSEARPGGYGEHPVPLAAPALANAIFAATGKRVRRLPITSEALRRA